MENKEKEGIKASWITIFLNLLLSIIKLSAGTIGHSISMISDSIHSASDVLSTVVVIFGLKWSAKKEDAKHPYGHERIESLTALFLSLFLFVTGLLIGVQGIKGLFSKETIQSPTIFALTAAIISIFSKEAMFWYTRNIAIKIKSNSLMADAWHHRSDAFSSIGSMIGILCSMIGIWWADSLASLIICFIIIKVSYKIGEDAINELLDTSCDSYTEFQIRCLVLSIKHIKSLDRLKTRRFGNRIYVEIEIGIPKNFSLENAHNIAHTVHDQVELKFPKVKHCMVHVNPMTA